MQSLLAKQLQKEKAKTYSSYIRNSIWEQTQTNQRLKAATSITLDSILSAQTRGGMLLEKIIIYQRANK